MATSSNVSTRSFRSAVSEAASTVHTQTTGSFHDTSQEWEYGGSQTSSRRSSASVETLRPAADNHTDAVSPHSNPVELSNMSGTSNTGGQEPEEARRTIVETPVQSTAHQNLDEKSTPIEPHSAPVMPASAREKMEEAGIEPSTAEDISITPQSHDRTTNQVPTDNASPSDQDQRVLMNESPQTTASSENDPLHPPRLNYTLRTRWLSIVVFWSLILIDSIAIPITLYFCLTRYAKQLSRNTVFSISTGALGGISIIEYFLRFYRLWRKGSDCRVLGARRWYLDWFHWNFSAAWIFIMVELIVGTVFSNPPIRLLAMPVSSMLFWFGFELLVEDTMRLLGYKAPLRISSIPKGDPIRPGIYSMIEDVVAVDGSGKAKFRVELNARYEASHDFRQMLHRLTLFWALGGLGAATLTTILVFTIEDEAGYVVGWTLPFVWAGIWALMTWAYVERCLKREKQRWRVMKA